MIHSVVSGVPAISEIHGGGVRRQPGKIAGSTMIIPHVYLTDAHGIPLVTAIGRVAGILETRQVVSKPRLNLMDL